MSNTSVKEDFTAINDTIFAGEVMRKRALRDIWHDMRPIEIENIIRALPSVTLEDLK